MDDVVKNLKKIESIYQKQINGVRGKIKQLEDLPKAKALLGKCFKFKNSLTSFPAKGLSWYYYVRVSSIKDCSIKIDYFEESPNNDEIKFKYDDYGYLDQFNVSSYIPISNEEYFDEQKKLLNKLMKRNKKERKC